MKYHFIALIGVLLFVQNALCQNTAVPDIQDVYKLTFLSPGVSYEKKIGRLQSIYGHVFMSVNAGLGYSSNLGFTSAFYLDPAFTIQYRYYYNAAKREAKGKRTEMNSLNYVSSLYEMVISKNKIQTLTVSEVYRRPVHTLGLAWGMQRNYPKRFSLDLNLGLGYIFGKVTRAKETGELYTKNAGSLTTIGGITLGFWLNNIK
jgi:hypothetical protein